MEVLEGEIVYFNINPLDSTSIPPKLLSSQGSNPECDTICAVGYSSTIFF
jgi:hypothetical protein